MLPFIDAHSGILELSIAKRDDVEHRSTSLIVCVTVLGTLSMVAVGGRMWARFMILKRPAIDDWLLLAGTLLTWVFVGLAYAGLNHGFGYHIWDLTLDDIIRVNKIRFFLTLLCIGSTNLIRISVLFFYRHLTRLTALVTVTTYVTITTIILMAVTTLAWLMSVIFSCLPIDAFWNQYSPTWRASNNFGCVVGNNLNQVLAFNILSILGDIITVMLPMSLFAGLNMRKKDKFGLMAVFGLGFLTVASGGVRMYWTIYSIYYAGEDPTWYGYNALLWSTIEPLLATICASAPTLKTFFRKSSDSRGSGNLSDATTVYDSPVMSRKTIRVQSVDDLEKEPAWAYSSW